MKLGCEIIFTSSENCRNGIFVSNEINDLFALMYADDVAGFSDTINRLQKLINSLVTFSDLIGIKSNLVKLK